MNLSNVSNITSTCTKATKTVDKIVPENTSFLKDKFNLEVTDINEKLPNICWTPKLPRSPTKARFIIAAPKFSVKPLSKPVPAALKLLRNQIKYCNFKINTTLVLKHSGLFKTIKLSSKQ